MKGIYQFIIHIIWNPILTFCLKLHQSLEVAIFVMDKNEKSSATKYNAAKEKYFLQLVGVEVYISLFSAQESMATQINAAIKCGLQKKKLLTKRWQIPPECLRP